MTGSDDASFGDAAAEMANETEVEAPAEQGASASAGPTGPTVVDQETASGEPRDEAVSSDDAVSSEGAVPEEAAGPTIEDQLAERTRDLQRLQAEYANYRKRVDRDRQVVVENATYKVLGPIIEVLDTIDRAKEHGELDGGFKAVAEQLQAAVTNLGLTRFGEPGDAFDPNLHDALSHMGADPEVSVVTCKHVAKGGYRFGDRVVRPAQVLVVDPAPPQE